MASSTLSLNQLLGNGAAAKGKKIGSFNVEDALLGVRKNGAADFQALLVSLGRSNAVAADTVGKILASSTVAATTDTKKGTGILADGTISPELLATLKALTPEQIDTLKINATLGDGDLGDTTIGILDALSSFTADGEIPEFFTVVDDPKLADALANLAAQVKMLQIAASTPENAPASIVITKSNQTLAPQDIGNTVVLDGKDFEKILAQLRDSQDGTITIVNTSEGDSYDLLKKIAFADLAPFLTQPRTVRIDSRTVMKVAQGPSFLNDEGTDSTAMTLLAGLVPVMVKAPESTATPTEAEGSTVPPTKGPENGTQAAIPGSPALAAFKSAIADAQANTDARANAGTQAQATPAMPATPAPSALAAAQTVKTAANIAITPNNAAARGFEHVAKGLDNELAGIKHFDLTTTFDEALRVHADQTLPANSTTSLIAAKSAGQPHPSTHLVSLALQQTLSKVPAGAQGERQFIIQLDPPNLGRLKITLDFIENGKVKAKMLAERPETLSLLQKDAVVLERALQGSGFDASAPDSLSFDLADSGDFSQGFGGGNGGHEGKGRSDDEDGTEFATVENVMAIFVDPETGLTHVNVVI